MAIVWYQPRPPESTGGEAGVNLRQYSTKQPDSYRGSLRCDPEPHLTQRGLTSCFSCTQLSSKLEQLQKKKKDEHIEKPMKTDPKSPNAVAGNLPNSVGFGDSPSSAPAAACWAVFFRKTWGTFWKRAPTFSEPPARQRAARAGYRPLSQGHLPAARPFLRDPSLPGPLRSAVHVFFV